MANKINSTNLLMLVAIVAVGFATVNLIITIDKIGNIRTITGYEIDTATANLTISSQAVITFTNETTNWGTGNVDEAALSATLDTEGTVTDGDWTPNYVSLILQNDGNVNVILNLSVGKSAASFIGGSADGGPTYKLKISANDTGSCPANSLVTYTTATTALMPGCASLAFADASDSINLDVQLKIPQDAVGTKGDIITATATAI